MPTSRTYAVIGAGHGGKAMAAHLALLGCQVTLYNRTAERVAAIKARGGIDLENPEAAARLRPDLRASRLIWPRRWPAPTW